MSAVAWTERELRGLIVKACQALHHKGLVAATDGNVSVRLAPDRVLVTPAGRGKRDVGALDILLCDMDGRKIRGRGEISPKCARKSFATSIARSLAERLKCWPHSATSAPPVDCAEPGWPYSMIGAPAPG